MHLFSTLHHHLKSIVSLPPDIRSITLALLFNGFAHNLVSVFIPLIIITNGGALSDVARFYLTYALVKLCINYPAMRIIQRYSASFRLYCGFISGALELLGISYFTATGHFGYILASAVALALTNAFGWNAQHLYLSRALNEQTRSSNLASISILDNILGMVAPLLAAGIATCWGAAALLWCAIGIILSTLIPLRSMYHYEKSHPRTQERLIYSLSGAPWRDIVANFCFNVETAIGQMIWPVYLALTVGSYQTIGVIATVGLTLSLVVVYYAGKRGDRGKSRSTLMQGCIAASSTNLLRLTAVTPLAIGIVAALYQCALRYLLNPWSALYYYHARHKGISYIVSMEIACDVAYLAVWLPFFLVADSAAHGHAFDVLFIIAAFAAYGPLLITKEGAGLVHSRKRSE